MADRTIIESLLKQVEALERSVLETEAQHAVLLEPLVPERKISARNLLHYLALRAQDLRPLQKDLLSLGISTLSYSEAYTLNNLQKVKGLLKCLLGMNNEEDDIDPLDNEVSAGIIASNAAELFGNPSYYGQSRIMVTLPLEAAENYEFVSELVRDGMNIARINTAYGDQEVWLKMIRNCKKAGDAFLTPVKIYMDLIGPRIRVGRIRTRQPVFTKGNIPAILLQKGDQLNIIRKETDGLEDDLPAITLTLPQLLDFMNTGESIWFDDGKMGGVIREKYNNKVTIEVTNAPAQGFKLREGKGINLPDSTYELPALTDIDLQNLPFIAAQADMVGYSFVRTVEDIDALQQELKSLNSEDLGVILKVEIRLAFDCLASLLFKVMQCRKAGIMIARGDLAVELGLIRMAEVQEEILWLAEAAHLPVIWATQILESQVKKGRASRGEISDVVKALRSECIMLNKGPHVVEALKMLKDIDQRMYRHEVKDHKMLRSLNVARSFLDK